MQTLRRERRQKFADILTRHYGSANETALFELLDAAESRAEHRTDETQGAYVTTIETAIYADVPVTRELADKVSLRDLAPKMFEAALGFTKPLPWWSNKDWTDFAEWVMARYAESKTSFGEYNIWRSGDGRFKGAMNNPKIRQLPNLFYDSWDMFAPAGKVEKSTSSRNLND